VAKPWTEVSNLQVHLQNGLDSAYLYKNSAHQVGVVVSVTPSNAGEPVDITQAQLDASITLIDYVTGEPLAGKGGWSSGKSFNGYHGAAAANPATDPPARINGLYQTTRYVACSPKTTDRTKSVAVQVQIPNGPKVSSGQYGEANAKVVMNVLDQIEYSMSDMRTYTREIPRADTLKQINYYLSIKNTADGLDHHIHALTLSVDGTKEPFFIWRDGEPRQKVAWAWPRGNQGVSAGNPSVAYNQRGYQEACITLLKGDFDFSGEQKYQPLKMLIRDQYGNSGTFYAKPSETPDRWEYGDAIEFTDDPPDAALTDAAMGAPPPRV
jgi:hypothetical protein